MKYILSLLFILTVSISHAQLKVEGVVRDSIGNPLEMANVIAINKETKALDSYGITNSEGRYKLSLNKNTTYNLQVSYLSLIHI